MFAQLQLQNSNRGIHYFTPSDTSGDCMKSKATMPCYTSQFGCTPQFWQPPFNREQKQSDHLHKPPWCIRFTDGHPKRTQATYTLLSVIDMESSVRASLDISLSLALVAGAKT